MAPAGLHFEHELAAHELAMQDCGCVPAEEQFFQNTKARTRESTAPIGAWSFDGEFVIFLFASNLDFHVLAFTLCFVVGVGCGQHTELRTPVSPFPLCEMVFSFGIERIENLF